MPNWLNRPLVARWVSAHPAVDMAVLSQGEYTMQSFLEILAITVEEGTSKKTGQAFRIPKAQCVLRNDDQSVAAVGVLNIPKALEEVAKPGLFTGTFALVASTYGESKGEIVARLTGLVAVPPSALRRGAPASA